MSESKLVKELVDKSNIIVDCAPMFTQGGIATRTCHECIIEKYSKLKENIFYSMTRDVEVLGRTLKLYKEKKTHSFQFHWELTSTHTRKSNSNIIGKVEFYIAYDPDRAICPGDLKETNYGFSIDVPNKFIVNPANKYLHEKDKLVVQFRYRPSFYPRGAVYRSGISRKKDAEMLSNDLLALYKSKKFADFKIEDGDKKNHLVHRWICQTRSATIGNIDDDNVAGITVKGKFRHVDIVIRYMYGGILPDLSVDDLLKVLEVADELDVQLLLFSIKNALIECLNASNAQKIFAETVHYDTMFDVAAVAEQYLPKKTEKTRRRRR